MSFWNIVWFIIISFFFVAYLMVMFSIIADVFRDRGTHGWQKAVWIAALPFFPVLTALIYLIARGAGMAERSARTGSPVDELAKAKALLDAGALSPTESEILGAKVLQ